MLFVLNRIGLFTPCDISVSIFQPNYNLAYKGNHYMLRMELDDLIIM
jgi:hypothetical protein